MRIVAGSKRGLTLTAPAGDTTRPTADRAREALFSILTTPKYAGCLRDRPVADFFAGTGALGLEAISRGASHGHFFETDPAALTALRANIDKAKWQAQATVHRKTALTPPAAPQPCGILFFDPPYHMLVAEQCLTAATRAGWLAPDGLAVVQIDPKADFATPDGFTLLDDRKYGAARFLLLERTDG